MKKTVAIIAPMIDEKLVNIDFNLKLKRNNRQLTLATLHDLARNGYQPDRLPGHSYEEETIPAAGYWLTGLLRADGYNTALTNTVDDASLREIASEDPFAICISSTMIFSNESLQQMVARIRRFMPESFIIIGGVSIWKNYLIHTSSDHSDGNGAVSSIFSSEKGLEIDANVFVVSPHGGRPLLMVLKELERGEKADFEKIPNLALPDNKGGYIFTTRQDEEVDYNSDYTKWELLDELPTRIPIRTSIGCPYRCRYCDFCYLYPKIFLRSKESLLSELQTLKKLFVKKPLIMHATDDNVFINKKRINDVCSAITESGIKGWMGFMRASSINSSNIELIKRSGLILSLIGVESGDQGQLERMNKRQKLEDMKQGMELLDNSGICVSMTFIVGFPGETAETIHNTAEFINNLSIGMSSSNYHLYPLNVCPISDLSTPEFREKWNVKGMKEAWSHDTMNASEAVENCYKLIKQIPYVPYHYIEESHFFNRSFRPAQRKTLFHLRQRLTWQLLEQEPWHPIADTFADISRTMEFSTGAVSEDFRDEIVVPKLEKGASPRTNA